MSPCSETQSARLFFADCRELLHLWLQTVYLSDSSIDHLKMSMCSLLFCCQKRVFAMTSVLSWQNSVSLCPVSFCTATPNLPVTTGISWLPSFAFQSPIVKRTFFVVVVLILEGLIGLHRTIQLQLLHYNWLGHRLGLLWHWKVCLGNEQRSYCHFWDCTQKLHFRLFCWLGGLLYFF